MRNVKIMKGKSSSVKVNIVKVENHPCTKLVGQLKDKIIESSISTISS